MIDVNVEGTPPPVRMSLMRLGSHGLTVLLMAALGAYGAKEPKRLSLSGITYNYTDQAVAAVRVNGNNVSAVMDAVQPVGVSGGAVVCCVEVAEGASDARVEVDLGDTKFTTQAKIEKWWPDLAHYAVVHVLPGRKVVMEIRSVDTWPRQDLLEQQIRSTGIKKIVNFSGPMNTGPMARAAGIK